MGRAGAGCRFSQSRRSILSDLNSRHLFVFVFLVGLGSTAALFPASRLAAADTWRGLVVAPEYRCSPYISRDYSYPQSVEAEIVAELGGIYSPYTLERFASTRETDIEHIVARSEAHDRGLCAADLATRRRFASDLLNLTLADPGLNRHVKRDHDATLWMPPTNRCWFANRVVEVRHKYGLSIDRLEAKALENVLRFCLTTELPSIPGGPVPPPPSGAPELPVVVPLVGIDALRLWDDNRNGWITCDEARRHGIAPVPRDHSAYPFVRDGDGDGVLGARQAQVLRARRYRLDSESRQGHGVDLAAGAGGGAAGEQGAVAGRPRGLNTGRAGQAVPQRPGGHHGLHAQPRTVA